MYSLESPHQGDSKSTLNIQLLCWNLKKNNNLNYHYLFPDLEPWLNLSGSNYPCLKQFSMVPKIFEPLKVDWIHGKWAMPWGKVSSGHVWTMKNPRPEVIKPFSCSTQLSMKFSVLINMKMPTIVGIFIFISREIFMLSYVKQERLYKCQ